MKRLAALAMGVGAMLLKLLALAPAAQAEIEEPNPPRLSPVLQIQRAQAPPQVPPQVLLFRDDQFDVTGAGLLELGDIDAVLRPFQADFGDGTETIALDLTVDAIGAVTRCTAQVRLALDAAWRALCDHARANGRFVKNPLLLLDYSTATYRTTVRLRTDRTTAGSRAFSTSTGFPHQGRVVQFGLYDMPPPEERLALADVQLAGMEYPLAARQSGLEGRVEVLVTFNEAGRVATCRPILSSNSARLAYDTCFEVRRVARRISPPDNRPFAFTTRWVLAD